MRSCRTCVTMRSIMTRGVVLSLQRMVGTYHPNRVVNEDHTVSAAHGNTETIDKEELQKALDEQHSTQQNAQ